MKIAIFPSAGLGDGIIQLLLAQNLAKLDLEIDFYHHYLADLNQIIDCVSICNLDQTTLENKLDNYNAILVDSGAKALDLSNFPTQISNKLAIYSMARVAMYSVSKRRRLYNPDFIAPAIIHEGKQIDFNCFNGQTISPNRFLHLNTADHVVRFLKRNKLVDAPEYELALSFPSNWQKKKYSKRILIHPTSADAKKNWLPCKYIELAKQLKKDGFSPVFTMSPNEKKEWEALTEGKFEIPVFENMRRLAKYYYESAMLIGNDSGNGHLASALGLPTITLIGRRSKNFTWRPNWSENHIVRPLMSRKLVGDHYWKYTLTVKQVLNTFKCIQL